MRVDQEVGIGGDAVEMHDFNDLEPPHVSPLDSPFLDMTSNWNLGLYVSGVPADSTSLTQETEHGASSGELLNMFESARSMVSFSRFL